ncbi:ATP-binding protein [Rhizobiaceae bacterium BDR2-2]|uniref:ATP-binding protein n=1 Tax=Ectorhizobium quercum TaxID=2965071 RepID=A0AAE3N3C0_9HYPH|nr:ATP-binding protein [Ectorhizobium quercum]MCX8999147.1 ATP-binding protein [Ectorhizobium quercum]
MALPIIGADERLAQRKGIKGVIFGRSGIGKTSLLWTLNASTTLFIDLEAGDLAVEGLEIDTLRPRTWKECRDFAVFIGGPNPALREDQPYSQAHFDEVCGRYGDQAVIGKYETVFIDSITVAGRLCFQWCRGQPEATSEKTGKPDIRGAYGLHGREMIACQTLNLWLYPAKDRSGRLDLVEPPHLGRLMEKIQRPARPASERLSWPPVIPADPAAETASPTQSTLQN